MLAPVKKKEQASYIRLQRSSLPIESFKIDIEPQEYTKWYRPGQNINGKVTIKNCEHIICKGIRVVLEGSAVVSYLSENTGLRRKRTQNLFTKDWSTVHLLGSAFQTRKESHFLKSSTHEYPFSIRIRKLEPFPGTLKEEYGEIVYRIAAYIDTNSPLNKKSVSEIVRIKGHFNLRTLPMSAYPVTLNGKARVSPVNDKIKFTLQLPRTSFLSWGKIPFKIMLIGPQDWEDLPIVCVSLLRRIIFKSDVSSRCITTTLSYSKHSEWNFVDKDQFWNVEWNDSLNIPAEAKYPTFSVEIIQCIYSVQLEMITESCVSPYVNEVPITIGTTREQ